MINLYKRKIGTGWKVKYIHILVLESSVKKKYIKRKVENDGIILVKINWWGLFFMCKIQYFFKSYEKLFIVNNKLDIKMNY